MPTGASPASKNTYKFSKMMPFVCKRLLSKEGHSTSVLALLVCLFLVMELFRKFSYIIQAFLLGEGATNEKQATLEQFVCHAFQHFPCGA